MYEEELKENDIYVEAGVLDYSDNDEITAMEEGFMLGYLEA